MHGFSVRHLIAHGLQTVCFSVPLAVEQLVMALRQDKRLGVAPDMSGVQKQVTGGGTSN